MFPPLYPIVDTGVCRARGFEPLALAAAYLRGGARLLQLRYKPLTPRSGSREWLDLAAQMAALARGHGAMLIVNDRADIARLADAGGVHVGQDDLPEADARRIVGPSAVVGISTHTEPQVDEALGSAASYVAVGPVFGTATKNTGYTARGLALLHYAAAGDKPVVAIGGITLDNAPTVRQAGASSIAVITDLLTGNDPEARVRAYLAALRP